MTTTEATLTGIGAIVVFWIVGAYNRMVRLKSELVARFAAVDERGGAIYHTNVLLALGMQMLSPTQVSLPFKLLLFVAIDGWGLLARSLVAGYHTG